MIRRGKVRRSNLKRIRIIDALSPHLSQNRRCYDTPVHLRIIGRRLMFWSNGRRAGRAEGENGDGSDLNGDTAPW